MKNILKKINIPFITYFFLLIWFITGFIKSAFLIILIILVHELGHIMICLLLKYSINKITIYPYGGITEIYKPINTPIIRNFLISIFGVVMQLILYLLFVVIYHFNLISNNTFNLFTYYNSIIILFNLLIIYPLDGFKVFECLVERFIPYYYSRYIMFVISLLFLAVFVFYNFHFMINNYMIIIILLFEQFKYFKRLKIMYHKFLMERLLMPFKYYKIAYNKKINIKLLKRDTHHYFINKNKVYSEKEILLKKFDINRRF